MTPLAKSSTRGRWLMAWWAPMLLAAAGCQNPYEEVLLIGHRGSPSQAPENSLEGFELAYRDGAEGVEFDVQWSRDGRNVVMHDDTLDRTTTCSGLVRDRTLDELRACRLANGEAVTPLDEMLPALRGMFQVVYVELKIPDPTPSEEVIVAQTDEAVDCVLRSGYAGQLVIISYDDLALQRVASRQREGVIGGWDDMSAESIADASRYHLPWVLMPVRTVEPWMDPIVRGLDKQLAVYQVTTPTELTHAMGAGASAVMTDSVPATAAMLGRTPR